MIETRDWIALTVKQEAEGEDFLGKLAVACVIVNRMRIRKQTAAQVVLAPYQFSCWNTDSPTRLRLATNLDDPVWLDSYYAADAAIMQLKPDPTGGCTSYLNPDACTDHQKAKAGYQEANVRLRHGHHHFFIAV